MFGCTGVNYSDTRSVCLVVLGSVTVIPDQCVRLYWSQLQSVRLCWSGAESVTAVLSEGSLTSGTC